MPVTRRTWIALGLGSLIAASAPAHAQTADVTVFAAASLKNALDAIGLAWTRETGKRAVVSYAASSALAKQIEAGAPADLFISADLDWMDWLAERKLIKSDTQSVLLGNRIVLIAPKDAAMDLAIAPGFSLTPYLGEGGRLAMANVESVPAGKYGKAALEALGAWSGVAGRIAQAENVRAALLLVSRGEAPLGIVYRTDAAADPSVTIVGTFPEDAHPPILYPAAQIAASQKEAAPAFLAYLRSPAARKIFEKEGFLILPPKTAS